MIKRTIGYCQLAALLFISSFVSPIFFSGSVSATPYRLQITGSYPAMWEKFQIASDDTLNQTISEKRGFLDAHTISDITLNGVDALSYANRKVVLGYFSETDSFYVSNIPKAIGRVIMDGIAPVAVGFFVPFLAIMYKKNHRVVELGKYKSLSLLEYKAGNSIAFTEFFSLANNRILERSMLNNGAMPWQYGLLYTLNSVCPSFFNNGIGDDVYNKNATNEKMSFLTLGDTALWQSLYHTIFHNWAYNKFDDYKLWSINVGGVKWTPGLRLRLSPFGPEGSWYNCITYRNTPLIIDIHGGPGERKGILYDHKQLYHVGLDINAPKLFSGEKYRFHARGSVWYQPTLREKSSSTESNPIFDPIFHSSPPSHSLGGGIVVGGEFQLLSGISFLLEGGYKTKGFWMGESMSQTGIVRAGMVWSLEA